MITQLSTLRRLAATTVAAVCTLALASQVSALTINDAGVVGVVHGDLANSNPDTETAAAQKLLDMLASTIDGQFETSDTEYSGTVSLGVQMGGLVVPAGWEYALAKYDGQNGGYVLFHIPTYGTVLPEFSYSIWWNGNDEESYEISHFTVFNPNGVPDGGMTVVLIGAGLAALGYTRRRLA